MKHVTFKGGRVALELVFGYVSVQDKNNKTHHFRVRDKKGILKLIHIFNGNLLTERKNNQFKVGSF